MDELQISARIHENLAWAKLAVVVKPPAAKIVAESVASPLSKIASSSFIDLPPRDLEVPVKQEHIQPDIPANLFDRNVFIFVAYQTIFGRDPSPVEILHHARLLRFLPFLYSRRRFLARLRGSWEAMAFESRVRVQHEQEVRARFLAMEHRHEQLRVQVQALQRSLTEASYGIVEDILERQKQFAKAYAKSTPSADHHSTHHVSSGSAKGAN
jgi:hypothetical protein